MALLLPYLNTTTIVLGLIAIFLSSYHILRRSKSGKGKAPPQAGSAWPIIGHLPLLTGTGPKLPHLKLAALADKYGPIFSIRIGIHPALVISSWELAKEIFTTHDVNVSCRPELMSNKLVAYGSANFGFVPYGKFFRDMRKIIASELLSIRRLDLLKHVRASELEVSVKGLYKLWNDGKDDSGRVLVAMKHWCADINLNVILRMVAGKRYFGSISEADKEQARRCQKVMREFIHFTGLFVLRDAVPFLGWLDVGGFEKAMKRTFKELDNLVGEWLEEHRRKRGSGCESDSKDQDFIDVLLSALDGIDLSGYDASTVSKATSVSLIAGGTDTSTVSETWVLALLLNNPNALKKAQEELDIQVGKDRLVTESDIDKLVYLQAVVKEGLRLQPAAVLTTRILTDDCFIGGYHVPAGTWLIVNLHKIQRDPRIWSNPLEFKPERFLATHKDIDVKGQHFELIPFGAGRRICPGMNFGLQMTHFLLASFLQAFDVSTPSNAPIDMTGGTPGLTNSIACTVEVLVKPRLPANLYQDSGK